MSSNCVHIVRCLCPQRHCIMALAYEEGASTEAQATEMLRGKMAELGLHPWCGICGLGNFQFEDRQTPFATMKEAQPFLEAMQMASLLAMTISARMPKPN
jgi:hypothetical protein